MTFRRILVATDFAESAERALTCGVQLARRHSAELILLHVYMDLPAYPEITAGQVEAIYEEQRRWIEDALERRARAARAEGLLSRALLKTGPAASTIAETAAEEGVDLIVVGTHGRSLWILDDLQPIREYTPETAAEAVHLFAPADAVRWRYGSSAWGTRGSFPDPPKGAVIYYALKD